MAIDKAIDSTEFDSKLTTVADAIRTAGGTTEPMSFPSGMVSAISELKGGSVVRDGATFTPSVSADGTLSWTNNKGLVNPEPVNIKGPPGPQGQQGEPGAAATVTVGTVPTGAPGTDAIVTNSGTESAAVLDFTIPKGETGAGIPDGGTVGQLLGKTEAGTAWIDPPQSGGGAEPDTITWDGETSGRVSADANGHLYDKVSDYVPKIKDLIGGTVSCSDGGKKVIAVDDVEYMNVEDNGFEVYTSDTNLSFYVVYKDNAVINFFDFPQKGVYFEKGTAFVSALSFTVTNDSNVTVETNVTVDAETSAITPTVVTPMCLIKEAAGRGFVINATMRMNGMTLSSFSVNTVPEFTALFADYPGVGLSIYVYAVKCSYNGACSVSAYTLTMEAMG